MLDRFLMTRLMPRLLIKACDATIPRSGEAVKAVNCFSVRSIGSDGASHVLRSIQGNTIVALDYDGDRYSIPTTIQIEEIDPCTLVVKHFFGPDYVIYTGIRDVALGRFTGWPYVKIYAHRVWNSIAQIIFNRRTLTTRRRTEILAEVVRLVESGYEEVSSMDIMSSRYGDRWAGHPHWQVIDKRIEFHLEMLEESGELRKKNYNFVPTGLALKAIEETEELERRHKENLRLQFVLGLIGLGSLIMAAAQAGLVSLPTMLDLSGKAGI